MRLPALLFILWPAVAHCQLNGNDLEQVYSALANQGSLNFTRVSTGGEFRGCELQFNSAVRDWRARNGAMVNVSGSISSFYQRDKAFNVNLKILGEDLTLGVDGSLARKQFRPEAGGLRLNGTVYPSTAAITVFKCEPSAICMGFADPTFKLLETLMVAVTEDAVEVLFTRDLNGMDLVINLATILPKKDNYPQYLKFMNCYLEYLKQYEK